MATTDREYLLPTEMIDSSNPIILDTSLGITKGSPDAVEASKRLFLFVRDQILYDPYSPFFLPEHYRASRVLHDGKGFCIQKASLLCALLRAQGIPARVGFATVRNHLATRQLIEYLGSDRFVYHAFVELFLNERWVKATPAFNKELCQKFNVPPLEFNGIDDCMFQAYNQKEQKFMEYLEFHGSYADIPVAKIVEAFRACYGDERVDAWIRAFQEGKATHDPFIHGAYTKITGRPEKRN